MKQALLLHGTGGNSKDYFWFADTRRCLENHGYQVLWPQLPNPDRPNLKDSLLFLEEHNNQFSFDKDNIVIGHSSACPLILTWLQYFKTQIGQVILVSGFYQPIDDKGFSEQMLQSEEYDWAAIKAATKEIILINSDNDPWKCDDKQAWPVAEKLGAKFILAEGQGHMGSDSFNQPYREFLVLKDLIT